MEGKKCGGWNMSKKQTGQKNRVGKFINYPSLYTSSCSNKSFKSFNEISILK